MRFVDTNVLLYAVGTAKPEGKKTATALEILRESDLALSVQVLQEFYVQATRASRGDRLTHDQAAGLIESWLRFTIGDITVPIVQAALALGTKHRLGYWDAAIIESARALGCSTVLSEDFSHSRDYDGVVVLNPFI